MLESLFTANSGLEASQAAMDVIGNNIANINTVGFKSSDVAFQSLFNETMAGASSPTAALGGTNPQQVGLGVAVVATPTNFSQGTAEATGNPLDVSIQGNGLLVLDNAGQTLYTRAGQLQLDANGSLVEPDGSYVQGWMATNGSVNTAAPLTHLTIPTTGTSVAGTQTSNITLTGNLNTVSPKTGPTMEVTVYDATGKASTLTLQFQPPASAGGAWTVAASDGSPSTTGSGLAYGTNTGSVTFNASGVNTNSGGTVTVTDNSGNKYTLNVANLSANALAESVAASNQNGSAPGTLESYSIGQNGQITGVFSNGNTQVLGQIALASFANEGGLQAVGSTEYAATANSGLPQIGTPGTGALGTLSPGTLEQSNVDLGQAFTNLIMSQRAYQANANVLSTSNTVIQSLLQATG